MPRLAGASRTLAAAVLIALLALAGACTAPHKKMPAALADKPNILLISIDSLRADHVGCYGYARATTPNIDKLAGEGTRFARALAAAPWTLPSHLTMLTGHEPDVLGVSLGEYGLADHARTIANVLTERGYRTNAVVCAPYLKRSFGFDHGFESYDDKLAEAKVEEIHKMKRAPQAVDRALKVIRERRGERWFLFLHFWDVHFDYVPPAPFRKKFVDPKYSGSYEMEDWATNASFKVGMDKRDFAYAVTQYDGGIAAVDAQLGRLFAALRRAGEWERTAVILTADHGDEFLDHGQKSHGHSVFDELLHVPLIVKGPNRGDTMPPRVPPNSTIACTVGLIDLFPTIAELAGADAGAGGGPGESLLALARDPNACRADREFFAETYCSNLDKLDNPQVGHEVAIEKNGWKYCDRTTSPRRQLLFHIAVDPAERDDCLTREPGKADELRALLRAHAQRDLALKNTLRLFKESAPVDQLTAAQLKQLGYMR